MSVKRKREKKNARTTTSHLPQLTPSSTAIRPAHATSPFVPSLYVSPDSDHVSGV